MSADTPAPPDPAAEREALAWFRERAPYFDLHREDPAQVHAATIVRAALARDVPATFDDDAVCDLVLAWGQRLDQDRYVGTTPENARISVTSAEVVDLARLVAARASAARDVPAPGDEQESDERAARSWLTDIVEDEPEGAYTGRTAEEIRDATRTLALLDGARAELAETRASAPSSGASTLRALLGSVASGGVPVEDAARLIEQWPAAPDPLRAPVEALLAELRDGTNAGVHRAVDVVQRHLDAPAPDPLPEPDRWHVEDDVRVPHWDLPIGAWGGVTAWNEGLELDGDLAEGDEVRDVEVTARKLLAAVAWHRKFAGQAPAQPDQQDGDRP